MGREWIGLLDSVWYESVWDRCEGGKVWKWWVRKFNIYGFELMLKPVEERVLEFLFCVGLWSLSLAFKTADTKIRHNVHLPKASYIIVVCHRLLTYTVFTNEQATCWFVSFETPTSVSKGKQRWCCATCSSSERNVFQPLESLFLYLW